MSIGLRGFGTGFGEALFLNPLFCVAWRTSSRFVPALPTSSLPVPYPEPPHIECPSSLLAWPISSISLRAMSTSTWATTIPRLAPWSIGGLFSVSTATGGCVENQCLQAPDNDQPGCVGRYIPFVLNAPSWLGCLLSKTLLALSGAIRQGGYT